MERALASAWEEDGATERESKGEGERGKLADGPGREGERRKEPEPGSEERRAEG